MAVRSRFVVSVVLLPAAACGLLVSDDLTEPGKADAVTGFADTLGVEVCLEGKHVVSPSQAKDGPLSYCLGPEALAIPCLDGEGCRSGERCICGRCTTRSCRNATECEGGEVCQSNRCVASCAGPGDCLSGETCSSGGCARMCGRHEDCAFGEKCSAFDGTCVVNLCGETVACGGQDVCVAQEIVADLREPHLLRAPEGLLAFFELRRGADCAIHRARVEGHRRWVVEPAAPVLEPTMGDGGCVGAPSVVLSGGVYEMFAARGDGQGILRARSTDGVSFVRDEELLLTPSLPWEAGWVGAPGVAERSGQRVLVYEGGRGAGIGIARVDSSGAERVSTKPWLVPGMFEDAVLWRNVDRVGSPFAVERDGVLLVYLTVRGVEGSDATTPSGQVYLADANDSIGLVSTRDFWGVEVFVGGPVFARRTNLRAYLGEAEPSVLFESTGSWMAYAGSDASGQLRTGLGLASTLR